MAMLLCDKSRWKSASSKSVAQCCTVLFRDQASRLRFFRPQRRVACTGQRKQHQRAGKHRSGSRGDRPTAISTLHTPFTHHPPIAQLTATKNARCRTMIQRPPAVAPPLPGTTASPVGHACCHRRNSPVVGWLLFNKMVLAPRIPCSSCFYLFSHYLFFGGLSVVIYHLLS